MLKLKNINITFNKNTVDEAKVFDNFNLTINDGEFVSIVGSNGSGKTTLLNLISGTLLADSGEILLNENNITNQKEFIRAKKVGRVFQSPSMGCAGSMTIAENLAIAENKNKRYGLSLGLNKKRLDAYKELLHPLGLGLENRLNTPVGALSGGQRQLLSLLTATMTDIDLLLLDEHTAALDPKTAEETMLLTNKIVTEKKITTLMVTHNLRFATIYGSRLLMMDKGNVVIDKSGKEKQQLQVNDLLDTFTKISIECGN